MNGYADDRKGADPPAPRKKEWETPTLTEMDYRETKAGVGSAENDGTSYS